MCEYHRVKEIEIIRNMTPWMVGMLLFKELIPFQVGLVGLEFNWGILSSLSV